MTVLILAALALTTVTPPPSPVGRAVAVARVQIIEAVRIDFKTAKVRIREDQVHSIDFE